MGPRDAIDVLLSDMAEHDPYVRQVLEDRAIENEIDAANEEKRRLFEKEA